MITGITGHQDLGDDESIQWIYKSLREEIQKYHISLGLTCLAIGADQLFAKILSEIGVPYTAIVPSDGYEKTFEDPNMYFDYLSKARDVVRMDFSHPCEEAYYAAGRYITDHADILCAVWNGKPAKGLGGTGDIVKYAKEHQKRIVHVNPLSKKIKSYNILDDNVVK